MPNLLRDLPAEVLTKILSFLPGIDLESCKLVSRDIKNIISSSSLLHYLIAADLAGVEDDPRSQLSVPMKLSMLTSRELSWRTFKPDFIQSISVDHSAYGLTNGVHVISAFERPWLYYFELPTVPSQALVLSRIDSYHDDDAIIGVTLAASESDLVAIITSAPDPNLHDTFRIELSFRSVKSGKTHPLAQRPAIPVEFSSRPPMISIEIVGDVVALAVVHHTPQSNDRIYVWNWKTGAMVMSIDATYRTYPSVTFLTGDFLLVPNAPAATFEFWRIPSSFDGGAPGDPTHILGLPPLARGMQISRISCRGEPHTFGSCPTLHPNRPFRASSQQAIIIFHIYVDFTPTGSRFILTLVVHRCSLVNIISKQISPGGIQQPLPWADWGPSSTRWFVSDGRSPQWITASAGQRCASISPMAAHIPSPMTIYDFNPCNVVKMRNYLKHHLNRNMFCNESEEELEDVPNIFQGPVRSALPYCRTRTEGLYTYKSVLMDEETLVGIKVSVAKLNRDR